MLKFDAVALGADIRKLRENGVAVANKSDDVARMALAGLKAGEVTQSALTVTALAAHGNPKTPKGKAVDSINGLRYAKGGEAARNCFRAIFEIDDNLKTYGEALPAIGEAIDAYVAKADGAAKGLYVLRDAVRAAVKAKLQADDPAAAEQEAKAEGEAEADGAAPPADPTAHAQGVLASVAEYIASLPVDVLAAVQMELLAVREAVDTAAASIEPIADAA
ncbi:hypothetical protein KNJ79_05300 [Sphingopyxis indica]|uniref:hypothetical protein n=1 Tax=Sphingopyxis indica TaxID=436663 RepID=UPI0029390B8B|nr:hypothetical protein [Sphingopyxis indica]WOF44349.1 hypothetical protein KNJ79_05300 [Sphingopyxis indica]